MNHYKLYILLALLCLPSILLSENIEPWLFGSYINNGVWNYLPDDVSEQGIIKKNEDGTEYTFFDHKNIKMFEGRYCKIGYDFFFFTKGTITREVLPWDIIMKSDFHDMPMKEEGIYQRKMTLKEYKNHKGRYECLRRNPTVSTHVGTFCTPNYKRCLATLVAGLLCLKILYTKNMLPFLH